MSKKVKMVQPEAKKFTLSKDEAQHLRAIDGVREYLRNLISDNMNSFVNNVVKTRLGIDKDVALTIDLEKGELTIIESQPASVEEQKQEVEAVVDSINNEQK